MLHRHNSGRRMRAIAICVAVVVGSIAFTTPAQAADSTVVFGYQAWPGVTVKSQIAVQLLEAMGYEAKVQNLSSSFIYQGLKTGDVDVSLGAWMPAHKAMVQPLVQSGEAIKLSKNLEGAIQGLAVPEYTWEAGIHTISDLHKHGDMFNRTIYGIAPGAAMSRRFQRAIDNNYKGLGDWRLMTSSTAGMLAQVGRATSNKKPVVFHGWRPHWMNIKYDIRFLKDVPDSPLATIPSTVYTIVRTGFPKARPEVTQFLRHLKVTTQTQSRWIYRLSYKQIPGEEVATTWISQNLDTVAKWLEGVDSADGSSGIKAVRAQFGG